MIDLHTHTTASDGTLSPAALVRLAAQEGLNALAVTDHDTLDGLAAAREAGDSVGVRVITGIELAALPPWSDREVHLLGYFVDPDEPRLAALLARMLRGRLARGAQIVERLAEQGVHIAVEDVLAAAQGDVMGRPHVADVLVARGVVADRAEAFDRFLAYGRPAYVPRDLASLAEALETLRGAGAVPVLAHPGYLPLGTDELAGKLPRLAAWGLAGLECDYPSHDAGLAARLRRIAAAHHLVATAGSDYHGPGGKSGVQLGRATEGQPIEDKVLAALERARERRAARA